MRLIKVTTFSLVFCFIFAFCGCTPLFYSDTSPTVSDTVGFLQPPTSPHHSVYPTMILQSIRPTTVPPTSTITACITASPRVTASSFTTLQAHTASPSPIGSHEITPTEQNTPIVSTATPYPTVTPTHTPVPSPTVSPLPQNTASATVTDNASREPSFSASDPTATAPVASPIASQEATTAPSLQAKQFVFTWTPMPSYFKQFLGSELYCDMVEVIRALTLAQDAVVLTNTKTTEQWELLRRAIQVCFVPWRLLRDPKYLNGGPFEFDEKSGVLRIYYQLDKNGTKDEYLRSLKEFREEIEQIMSVVSDIEDKITTAKELFLFMANNISYYDDGKLTLYDAIMKRKGYCQTFSQMYRYLLWQADIPCYLCSGDIKHEWNVIELNGSYYFADTTWQATDNKPPLYYFGLCFDALKTSGHGDNGKVYISDELNTIDSVYAPCGDLCSVCIKSSPSPYSSVAPGATALVPVIPSSTAYVKQSITLEPKDTKEE